MCISNKLLYSNRLLIMLIIQTNVTVQNDMN